MRLHIAHWKYATKAINTQQRVGLHILQPSWLMEMYSYRKANVLKTLEDHMLCLAEGIALSQSLRHATRTRLDTGKMSAQVQYVLYTSASQIM